MPRQYRRFPEPLPGETCQECGQLHMNRKGNGPSRPTCTGHIWYDRASYVKGQARVRLDHPKPCSQWALTGQTRCRQHGGSAKQNLEAAERRRQQAEAEKLMMMLGAPVDGADPAEIITERIAVRAGHVRWLLAQVRELEPHTLTWGLTRRKTAVDRGDDADESGRRRFAGTDEGDTHEAKPHIWWTLYNEAADKLERLCVEAIRVGLDERRVRLAEQQADLWVRLIDGVLRDLGHDPHDPQTASVVARHLEAVA
jgi:hypothetical protein